MHLFIIPPWFNVGFMAAIALAAWRFGGWRERLIASGQLAEFANSAYGCGVWTCFGAPIPASLGIWRWHEVADDSVILAICLISLVGARRYWVLLACVLAIMSVLTDLTIYLPGMTIWANYSGSLIWSYALAYTVLWGVWISWRELRSGEPVA